MLNVYINIAGLVVLRLKTNSEPPELKPTPSAVELGLINAVRAGLFVGVPVKLVNVKSVPPTSIVAACVSSENRDNINNAIFS